MIELRDRIHQVSRDDVLRIVRRDFPQEVHADVIEALDRYGTESWHLERDRVQLAVLRLSAGSVTEVSKYIDLARVDFRDVIAPAEYPQFWKLGFVGIDSLNATQLRRLKDSDWARYDAWLRQ
jgi:hypothetical protein